MASGRTWCSVKHGDSPPSSHRCRGNAVCGVAINRRRGAGGALAHLGREVRRQVVGGARRDRRMALRCRRPACCVARGAGKIWRRARAHQRALHRKWAIHRRWISLLPGRPRRRTTSFKQRGEPGAVWERSGSASATCSSCSPATLLPGRRWGEGSRGAVPHGGGAGG